MPSGRNSRLSSPPHLSEILTRESRPVHAGGREHRSPCRSSPRWHLASTGEPRGEVSMAASKGESARAAMDDDGRLFLPAPSPEAVRAARAYLTPRHAVGV